jgi:hypothetical protein
MRAGRFLVPMCFLRSQAFGLVREDQSKAQMGDTQHVAGSEKARRHALAVDPGSIGAAQVANEDLAVHKDQAAVVTRYSRRIKTDITSSIAADERERLFETEVGFPVQGDEAREHDQKCQPGRGENECR